MNRLLINLALSLILYPSLAFAGITVCYNPDDTVKDFSLSGSSVEGCDYFDIGFNVTEAKYDQIKNLLKTVERRYLKKLSGEPVEMSSAEKVAVDDALAAEIEADLRANSKSQFDGNNQTALGLRCLAKVVLDEINTARKWTRDFKTEVAAATNLANLQSRVATLPTLNDRTLAQAKTAIAGCVDNLEADE